MSREQRTAVDAMLRKQSKPPSFQTVDEMRAGFAEMMKRMEVPTGVRTTPTRSGNRPALLVESEAHATPGTVLYFHGGAWVSGSPETALSLTANLVTRTGFRSISLDYRLAPEHPFPAAVDDGLAAFEALLQTGARASSIAFAGDSAGGGLCVATCLAARAAGLPMPAAVVAFSPVLDATLSGASMDGKAGIDPFFTRESLTPTLAMYLGGRDPNQELLSPALVGDLRGFPPVLLQVGTSEVLLDDSVRFADRARAASVDVILDVTADVTHVFQAFVGQLDEAAQALDRAALFLRQHIA